MQPLGSDGETRRGQFTEGRTKVHEENHSGRPSLVMLELMESVWQAALQNRLFTILELSGKWLQTLAVDSYDIDLQTLVHRYDKCFFNGGDC